MTAFVGVRCDGCKQSSLTMPVERAQPAVGPVRQYGRETGWHKTRVIDTGTRQARIRDICPTCWAEGRR
jgi:hypothetical protein